MLFARRQPPHATHKKSLTSLVGEGFEVKGDVNFTGGLRVDGHIHGQVIGREADGSAAPLLVLSNKGRIEGSVRCDHAVIDGTIDGDVDVEGFLELQSNARITGTIRYRQLRMDIGATVQGRMVRSDDVAVTASAPALALAGQAGLSPA